MNINLQTDATKHNLALMKISAWHKANGDDVFFRGVGCFDLTYGSWLFDFSPKAVCDIEGGPGVSASTRLDDKFEVKPDYRLFNLDHSLGFTWAWCPRQCSFCVVPKQNNPKDHKSIWTFHDSRFKKICLLNNNTFSDPQWKDTFVEIWDADLAVIDENGYDLRLMDDEKAAALKKTKFHGYRHYAWDNMEDETKVLYGLSIAPRGIVYVMIGYNTTRDEDFYRVQKIHDSGHDPYIMPFNRTKDEKAFKRFVDSRMYRKFKTIKEAWENYKC